MIRDVVEQRAAGVERRRSAGGTHSWLIVFWLVAFVGLGVALWITLFGVAIQP